MEKKILDFLKIASASQVGLKPILNFTPRGKL
jgi:hypothetical protein